MTRVDSWTRACDKFKEDLSDEEKRLFSAASPENLLAGTLISYQTYEAESKSHKVLKALGPFISIVTDYGAALDVLANTYSLVLSPLWGSLRVLLRIAEEAGKFFDKLVEMFARIADVLPRLQVYERLFSNHDRLLDMISTAYLDVLNFCIDAKATFRKRGAILKHVYWRPFQLRFQVSLVNMRNHLKSVEKEAMLSHMIETSEQRSLVRRDETLGKEMIKAEKRAKFLSSLSNIAYEKIHRRASKLRHTGSCGWLLKTDQYQVWIDHPTSATLSVVGNPGCGKTILASSLVDTFAIDSYSGRPVLYYYCDYSDPESLSFHSIVGTLLKQLLLYMGNFPPAIESRIDRYHSFNVQLLSENDLLALLDNALRTFDEAIIILDAIDECDKETQKDVVKFVKHLHLTNDTLVRCIIFSREEAKLTSGFQAYPVLKISSAEVSSDITAFVQESVAEKLESGDLVVKAPELLETITSTLTEGANGMFLWVRLQLDELCEASSDKEIRTILRDLPVGLTEIYKRILKKIIANSAKCFWAKRIFRWLACAKRTLELSELVEAVAFSPWDKAWDAEKLPDGSRALQACNNLVVLDEDTQQVRFVHHTVRQLLLSNTLLSDQECREFWMSEADESDVLARVLCAYLCFSDFETQVARVEPEAQLQGPDLVKTQESLMRMPHELPLGTLLISTWKIFRGFGTNPGAPTLTLSSLPIKKEKPASNVLEKYRLLDYAIQHWLSHVKDVYGTKWYFMMNDFVARDRFESLVFDKQLPFSFRPWGDRQTSSKFPYMAMFRWAVKNGHAELLDILAGPRLRGSHKIINHSDEVRLLVLRRYCIEEMENRRSPLLWAVQNGLVDVLTALDSTKIRSFLPYTPDQLLSAAARQPLSELLVWVLEKTEGLVDANDLLAALLAGIESGYEAVIKTLAATTHTLIATTRPFESNAKARLLLHMSTVHFSRILDWALNDRDPASTSLATTLTTHVLVPSLSASEKVINYPYVFSWAVQNNKAEFMRHFMRAIPFETIASIVFWEAAESVALTNDRENEVVKIMWTYLQPIDPQKYFNGSSLRQAPRHPNSFHPNPLIYPGQGSRVEPTSKGALVHHLNEEIPEVKPAIGVARARNESSQTEPQQKSESDANRGLFRSESQSMLNSAIEIPSKSLL